MRLSTLFAGIAIPEEARTRLLGLLPPLRTPHAAPATLALPPAAWADPRDWHITLRFLGLTPHERQAELGRSLAESVRASGIRPGTVRISGWGAFPETARARIFWAGLQDPEGLLERLARHLEPWAVEQGYRPEPRPFVPHLTLARAPGLRDLSEALRKAPSPQDIPLPVSEVLLYESTSQRPRYRVIDRYPLGAQS